MATLSDSTGRREAGTNHHAMTHDEMVAAITRIDERTERLDCELCGNGQPGRCASHAAHIDELRIWRSKVSGGKAVLLSLLALVSSSLAGAWLAWVLR